MKEIRTLPSTIHNNSKPVGCSKSSSRSGVYSNTIPVQETRKTSNRQPTLHLKTLEKEEEEEEEEEQQQQQQQQQNKISRRKEIIKFQAEIHEKEMKETIVKIVKLKAGSLRR